jgi:hypothetical protein
MESHEDLEAILPERWAEVLDRVQQGLARAEAAAAQRAEALSTAPPSDDPSDGQADAWRQCRQRLDERLAGLEACIEKARQETTDAEAALEDSASWVRRWLAESEPVRQRLAEGGGLPVG